MVTSIGTGRVGVNGRTRFFQALPEILRWRRNEAALFRSLNGLHAAVVRLGIRSICGAGSRPCRALAAAPAETRHRVELAPEVYRLVFHESKRSPDEIREALERFCAVENYLADRSTIEPRQTAGWSALGDVCIGRAAAGESGMTASGRSVRRTVAPVLRRTVIDGYSPFHATVFGELPTATLAPAGFREALSRLSTALGLIESTCEPAIAMLDACLKVAVPVRTPPREKMSVSCSTLPGMAGLGNLDSGRWDTETVADALVHEAVHALVSKVSLVDTLFSRDLNGCRVHAVSPWTGRRLPLLTFVHATFVWFGLWQFWKRTAPRNARAAALAERARKGFDEESPLRSIPSNGIECLAPDVLAALRAMTREAGSA